MEHGNLDEGIRKVMVALSGYSYYDASCILGNAKMTIDHYAFIKAEKEPQDAAANEGGSYGNND